VRAAQVKAIADVGSIVAGALHHADDSAALFGPLRTLASYDAAMIAVRDPLTGEHQVLANHGYPAPLLNFINHEYLGCPTYTVARNTNRPMRMRDYGPDFYNTRVYREFLEHAGFREGVTLVLRSRSGGRVTGMMTMSFSDSSAADDTARAGIEFVAPSLGQLVDAALTPSWLARVFGDHSASYLVDECGAAVPTSDASSHEQPSHDVLSSARCFLASGRSATRGYCIARDHKNWDRVHFLRLPSEQHGHSRALLMLKQEPLPHGITERELDVLTLLAQGLTNKSAGEFLGASPRTVGSHVEHLLMKTGCVSRAGLASLAAEDGLVRLGPFADGARGVQ
jgi:DNA-binding CsgD family transcriptional regulator